MSSMDAKAVLRKLAFLAMLTPWLATSADAQSGDASAWDQARAQLIAGQAGPMAQAVERWKLLTSSNRFSFNDYAGFLLAYPGFPQEDKLRRYAEAALDTASVAPGQLIAYFDKQPPLTNPARAQYALALMAMGRPEAADVARAAWCGGPMSAGAEAALAGSFGSRFTQDDQDAREDALLWADDQAGAERQLGLVSAAMRGIDAARLAALAGSDPYNTGFQVSAQALNSDPGFLYARARQLRKTGQAQGARGLLANRPLLARKPLDPDKWVDELLTEARGAASDGSPSLAVQIAQGIDDAFDASEDISKRSYGLRDDYTSLMWLGGTQALWDMGAPGQAAPLFYRYGAAARTPGTRSKGFYWAGRAAQKAGDSAGAQRYFEMAAQYADQYYGQLSLERLGRPMPRFAADSHAQPTAQERAAFMALPITKAVREVARESDWRTALMFFREISDQAQTEAQQVLVADLARDLGRRDLGVILGQAAAAKGYLDFQHIGFPLVPVPLGYSGSWTMIHAISRQESQFAQNALSHAGARGLMQLMPGTARQEAGRMGLSYSDGALMADPSLNIQLGATYFGRMMDYFGGSYPLAVAAYNAGPGNVNKWLRQNGDPRNGSVDWVKWVEEIPYTETRAYVQHVLENAVVYDAMNPDKGNYTGPNPISHYLGKNTPG
ncbi:MAG: lytic transglycosylase domain-containing protein [Sphingomonadales bacterium]|nr:lytic transglycosylase domain-containing protein [Sphingomonadales bacterium]MDE2569391.1 lytic transglycosylase domain-containing protein [Sphingomonadales bacterium]